MPRTILAILAIGAAARLWGYATAGPLWLDELFIDHNLAVLTFAGLLGPLLDGQNAPVGWLWLTKALRSGWGEHEAILRLPALLASLGSLPLAYAVARRAVGERTAVIPAVLVAWSPFAVWQSFQLKPYAVDLALALLLLWLAQRTVDPERAPGRLTWTALAGAGAAATWFSLPAIFVLAGVGAVLALDAVRRPGPGRVATCVALGAAWISSFGVHYVAFLRPRPQPEWLYAFWSSGLLAWPPERWDVAWLPRVLVQGLADPAGFAALAPLATIALAVGAVGVLDRGRRPGDALALQLAAAPIAFALLASALRLYPFSSRLVLFLLPSLGILVAAGFDEVLRRRPAARLAAAAVAAALLAAPTVLFSLWLPSGGLPVAADSRGILGDLAAEHAARGGAETAEPVVLGHLATYAWRRYAPAVDAPIHAAPDAWLDDARVESLARTLAEVGSDADAVWIVITRVRFEEPGPWTYGRFLRRQRGWPPVDAFRGAIGDRWRVDVEKRRRGAVLWRLVAESGPGP